jgi:hypothetical protein
VSNMLARVFLWLYFKTARKEEEKMLVRLYAIEIIEAGYPEDKVPAGLRQRVHEYLVMIGYYEE